MEKIKEKITDLSHNLNLISIKVEAVYFLVVSYIYVLLGLINYFLLEGSFLLNSDVTWFWAGLVMLIFSLFYIEIYFTAPTNVFANSFALFVLILSLGQKGFDNDFWWEVSLIILLLIIVFSLLSKALYNKNKSDDFIINIISNKIKSVLELVGSGRVLYSTTFLYFLFLNIFKEDVYFSNGYLLTLFTFFCFILIISPDKIKAFLHKYFEEKLKDKKKNIGKIFAVQSDNVFLVRLFDNKKIQKFSQVYFIHNITELDKKNASIGFLFDIYYLDNQKWGKIIKLKTINKQDEIFENLEYKKIEIDYVYTLDLKITEMSRFIGIVNENTTINKLYFEYSQNNQTLEIDDLLEVYIRDKKVFYQIINASTKVEKLESYNEKGSVVGEAIQLGCWNKESMSFNKVGWVPLINEAVHVADTSYEEEELKPLVEGELNIGVIPKTKLPSIMLIDEAVSHHTAILGVTGSGKSVFARKVIKSIKNKKIVIDLTAEWKKKLNSSEFTLISGNNLDSFLGNSDDKVGIIELTAMSGTGEVLSQVQTALEKIFTYCKNEYDKDSPTRITIILEEAHTIVPETNFLGELGDYGANKAIVNKLSQIALQGRKYGVGLLVIGQRSANISKTVLTQCNTIVAFKAFDDTSYGFLTNYFGKDIIGTIPNLKNFHAVVYGKGIKSNNPVIIDTYDKNEDQSKNKS
jgi:uncharacterized protein